jgi:hypothetical protein
MALGLIQSLTEMSTRNLPGAGEERPARKADNLTAICELIVQKCLYCRFIIKLASLLCNQSSDESEMKA